MFKKKVFAIGFALILTLTMTTGVFADTKTNEVDITVKSGEFSVTPPSIKSFPEVTLQESAKTYKTSFEDVFVVKDLRGTQAGWRLDVSASPLTNGSSEFPKGSLSLQPLSDIERVGTGQGGSPTKSMNSNIVIDDGKIEVAKADAGSGMGVFDITFPSNALSLVVDATTAKTGTYESTLTWDLVQAP